MTDNILKYIAAHPKSRKREIADGIGVWLCDKNFLKSFAQLKSQNFIHSEVYRDIGNMEFYDEWYITDQGRNYLSSLENF